MYRAGSFNTKVGVLRSQSPFYRMQEAPAPGSSSAAAAEQPAAAGRLAAEGIELKPAGANVLLGQAHLEGRGKFLPAHPVRRGASPLQQQQHVAVADEG